VKVHQLLWLCPQAKRARYQDVVGDWPLAGTPHRTLTIQQLSHHPPHHITLPTLVSGRADGSHRKELHHDDGATWSYAWYTGADLAIQGKSPRLIVRLLRELEREGPDVARGYAPRTPLDHYLCQS
jgi:hypothetical protein